VDVEEWRGELVEDECGRVEVEEGSLQYHHLVRLTRGRR
jgi:hypothetical protein